MQHLPVGASTDESPRDAPDFLLSFYAGLPADMRGTVSLVGVGAMADSPSRPATSW